MSSPKAVQKSQASLLVGNPMAEKLGENLQRLRKNRGLTQQNLAFAAEMDRTFISLCERGLANPSLYSLGTICWCLGITLAELFAGIEDTLPPSSSGAQKRRKNQASHEPRPTVDADRKLSHFLV